MMKILVSWSVAAIIVLRIKKTKGSIQNMLSLSSTTYVTVFQCLMQFPTLNIIILNGTIIDTAYSLFN